MADNSKSKARWLENHEQEKQKKQKKVFALSFPYVYDPTPYNAHQV